MLLYSGLHLILAVDSVIRFLNIVGTQGVSGILSPIKLPRIKLIWPEGDGQIRLPTEGTGYALLQDENNGHSEDVEANPRSN